MDKTLTLKFLDPELSFGIGSIGRQKKFLVDQNNEVIAFSRDFQRLGAGIYDLCTEFFSDDFTVPFPTTLERHNENCGVCYEIVESLIAFFQRSMRENKIRKKPSGFFTEDEILEISDRSFYSKIMLVDSMMSQLSQMLSDGSQCKLGSNVYFYCAMLYFDKYIELDLPYSDESKTMFNAVNEILHVLDKRAAIIQEGTRKAKIAVKVRHEKTYQEKEKLREWHKNNRHDFLKDDGSLHQNEAAEHVVYIIKLTTLKIKKVAEYMGEFERELNQ